MVNTDELPFMPIQTVVGVKDADNKKALIVFSDGSLQRRFPDSKVVFCVSDPLKPFKELKTTQELENGYLPIVTTKAEHESVQYSLTSFVWNVQDRIMNFTKAKIINKSTVRKKAILWCGLEGFTHTMEKMLRGFEKEIKYADDHLVLDGMLMLVFRPSPTARNIAVPSTESMKELLAKLERELAGLEAQEWEKKFLETETRLRIDSVELAVKYDFELPPKGETEIWIVMPTDNLTENEGMQALRGIAPQSCLKECRDFWETFLNKGVKINLPDKEVSDFYKASLAYSFIYREKVDENYICKPGATIYDHFWSRDCEGFVRAFDVAGYHKEAEECLDYLLYLKSHPEEKWAFYGTSYKDSYRAFDIEVPSDEKGLITYPIEPEKCFDCPKGQYDGQGQALKAFVQHYKITGDKEWLKKVYPQLKLGVEWIRNVRRLNKNTIENKMPSHHGLLPKGFMEGADAFPSWDYFLIHNYPTLECIPQVMDAAGALGENADVAWMKEEYEDYRKCLKQAVERAMITCDDRISVPHTASKTGAGRSGFYQRGFRHFDLFTCGIYDPTDETCTKILETVEKHFFDRGLIKRQIGVDGGPAKMPSPWMRSVFQRPAWAQPYLPLTRGRNAMVMLDLLSPSLYQSVPASPLRYITNCYLGFLWKVYVLRNEFDKALTVFRYWFDYAYRPTRAWIENLGIPTMIGHGDMPHGWIAAQYVTVVRDMLVFERGNDLHIAQCIPPEWLFAKSPVAVERAPTEFGVISFSIMGDESQETVEADLDFTTQKSKRPLEAIVIHLRHPKDKKIGKVEVDGKIWKRFDASTVTVLTNAKHIKAFF